MPSSAWPSCEFVDSLAAKAEPPALHPSCRRAGPRCRSPAKGSGPFKSTRFNQVMFQGVPALIQRWDADLIEVRVPSQAANGPVEVIIGKKHVQAGSFTRLQPAIHSVPG